MRVCVRARPEVARVKPDFGGENAIDKLKEIPRSPPPKKKGDLETLLSDESNFAPEIRSLRPQQLIQFPSFVGCRKSFCCSSKVME